MSVPGELPCTRCGAPLKWDGFATTIECRHCNTTMSTPAAKPIHTPGASGGSGAGLVIGLVAGGVVLLIVVLAVGGALFWTRSAAPPPPAVVISPPVIPSPVATVKPIASAATGLGTKVKTFGSEGTGPGQLDDARQIAVDLDENVYVADYDDGRVQKLDKDGKFVWIAAIPKNTLSGDAHVWGLAVDTKNTLWVCRTGDLFQLSTADGKTTGTVKGNYDNAWFRHLAVAPTGEIVTFHDAAGNTDMLRLDPKGKIVSRIKNKSANGVAIDGKKNAYLVEQFPDSVEVIDEKGSVVSKWGSKGDPHISGADAIAVDGKSHVFVAISGGVSVFDTGGKYLGEIKTSPSRSIAISTSNKLFVLTNKSTVEVYELGKIE